MSDTVVLCDEPGRELVVRRHGDALRVDSWELGDDVEARFGAGCREHERVLEVAARDIPALVLALGSPPGTDVIAAIAARCTQDPDRLETIIRSAGIPTTIVWSRIGD